MPGVSLLRAGPAFVLAVAPPAVLRESRGVKLLRSLLLPAIAFLLINSAAAADTTWLTNIKEAQQKAKAENKLVLLDFTGSDWCGWCIKLQREVFSKPEFRDYANKNLVLVEVDFPKLKQISAAVRQQNEQLAQKYQIEGFPTLVVLNGDGKPLGALMYDAAIPADSREMVATPQAFIASIEKLRKS